MTDHTPADPAAFETMLGAVALATETEIDRLLPELARSRLRAAMRYAVLGQGKRLRPFLVLKSAEIFGVDQAQALRVAAAVECVHCYSLVHDDLPAMDDDDVRRGKPTLHRKFDEATAILAGDGLLTFAFEILADPLSHEDATIRSQLIAALAKSAGESGMVGGQMLDIEAETKGTTSLAEVSSLQALKTGALFCFSCEAGAILGRGNAVPLRNYAEHIGRAFQIADDILDVESDPAVVGKATQKDHGKGKATFVGLLGLAGAKAKARHEVEQAVAALACYGNAADPLRQAAAYIIARRK
jgi:farnesyl diphosphate synthase